MLSFLTYTTRSEIQVLEHNSRATKKTGIKNYFLNIDLLFVIAAKFVN